MNKGIKPTATVIIHPRVMKIISIFWGLFGLHDFALKKWLSGIAHLALALIGIYAPFTPFAPLDGTRFIIPNILIFASLGWMAVELYDYLKTYKEEYQDNPDIQYKITVDTFETTSKLSILFSILAIAIETAIVTAFCLAMIGQANRANQIDAHALDGLDSLVVSGISLLHLVLFIFSWIFYSISKNFSTLIDPSIHEPIKHKLFKIARYLLFFVIALIIVNITLIIITAIL